MTLLNIDILMLIIDNVDNHHTLFSLLTVSKQVFRYTCQRLYRDPGYYLRDTANKARSGFTKMVLAFSPASDQWTNFLREILHIQQADSPPMADYLSFVRIVRWESAINRCFGNAWEVYSGSTHLALKPTPPIGGFHLFVENVLTMAICGHQPGNMRELDINFAFIEDFISRAPEFSRLERIFINEEHVRTDMDVYPAVIRLVKAIQLGGSSLYDCRLEHHRRHHPISPLVIELNSLLPVPRALQGLIESPRPLDRYLSQLEELHIESTFTEQWLQISRHYTDLPPWRILQCCRELTYLKIDCDVLTDDTNLLAWAAQEARDREDGERMPPAVPVVDFLLRAGKFDPVNALMIVRDALDGFSESLHSVLVRLSRPSKSSLDYGDSDDKEGSPLLRVENNELLEMPGLTQLHWTAPELEYFDPRLLLICPRLETLTLEVGDAIPAGRPVQLLSLAPYVRLTHLCLKGACVNAFDPCELANMVDLEELVLEQVPENSTPDRSLRMRRWTWDWDLPQLLQLQVRCAIEGWFSLKILPTCPRLVILSIDSTCRQLLEVPSELDDFWRYNFRGISEFTISGAWDITPTDLDYLLHGVFTGLRRIWLYKFRSCTALQVLQATRDHPALEEAYLPEDFLSLEERKDIGLCEDIDGRGFRPGDCVYSFGNSVHCVWNNEDTFVSCGRLLEL